MADPAKRGPHREYASFLPGGFDREYLALEQFNLVQCIVAGTTHDIQNVVLPRLFGGSIHTGDLSSLGDPPALAAVETHAPHLPIIIASGRFSPLAAFGDHTLAQMITHEGRHILQANGTVLRASVFSLMHGTWLWQQVFDAVLLEPDAHASESSATRPTCRR